MELPPICELLGATSSMSLQSTSYWWQLFRCPSNLRVIGGNFLNVPPIRELLVVTFSMSLQSANYWEQVCRIASNLFYIGGKLGRVASNKTKKTWVDFSNPSFFYTDCFFLNVVFQRCLIRSLIGRLASCTAQYLSTIVTI